MPPHKLAALGIGYVPQGRGIFPLLTVEENLTLGLNGAPDPAGAGETSSRRFPRIKERLSQAAGTLSGGEQQMLAIARCLLMKPEADHPRRADRRHHAEARRADPARDRRHRQRGISVLLVEQNLRTALRLANRIYLMERGQIVHEATPPSLQADPEIVHRYLGVSLKTPKGVRSCIKPDRSTNGTGPQGITRRSFLHTALAGGAAPMSALARDMSAFAQASGPIVIGHHCELTGGFASWGYWHNKCALAATKLINDSGGIAGRKLELVTEDTESNPATGARKLRSLIQRNSASFVIGSVHSGVMLASIPVATELKTVYFSTGEATEATGEKGTRYSFRTGTDTYGLAAAGAPWAFQNLGKRWTIISPDYAWGHSHYKEHKAIIEKLGGKVNDPIFVPLDAKDLVPYLTKIPQDTRGAVLGVLRRAVGRLLHAGQVDGPREDDEDVLGVRHHRGDRAGRSQGRGRRRLHRRELPAHGEIQGRRVPSPVRQADRHRRRARAARSAPTSVNAKSHSWQSWENLFALKKAIETSGWKTKKDDQGVDRGARGPADGQLARPSRRAPKTLRKEDHSGIIDCYISRIENDELHVKKKVTQGRAGQAPAAALRPVQAARVIFDPTRSDARAAT